jgi:sugar phosphate isomerase/epimerase
MKFILHSVSYSPTWRGQTALSLDQVVAKAAQLGFDGIELIAKRPHASPLDLSPDARKRLKETIQAKGLELPCIAGYQDFSTGMEHPDLPHFEKELLYLRETIRLSHDLGCRIVRIYSGFLRPNIPYEDQWNWCVQYIREGAKYAEDQGVFLALQNHSEITVHYQDVLAMVQEIGSPAMKVALDAPYIQRTGESLEKAVAEVGSLMVYSTASDQISRTIAFHNAPSMFKMTGYYDLKKNLTVPAGQGQVDYRTFFRALKSIGYDAYMAYEICTPIQGGGSEANLDRCAKQSLEYLRTLYREVYLGKA